MLKRTVAIIGGGLAGTACAYTLKPYVNDITIYEQGSSLVVGASGNDLGLYNPRFSAFRTSESDFYTSAYALALRTFKKLSYSGADISWNPCGAIHLLNDEKKQKRFVQTIQNWGWDEGHLALLNSEDATKISGVPCDHDALYLPESGTVSPKSLCDMYAEDIDIKTDHIVQSLDEIEADIIILACGMGAKIFEVARHLPLRAVRGQVSMVSASEISRKLKTALCYGGYCTPVNGKNVHMIGATFQRWLDHDDIIAQDDQDNIDALSPYISDASTMKIIDHRAAVRTTSPDHFPIVGKISQEDLSDKNKDIYVSTAHGSHGILSSLMSATLIADMILGRPLCLPNDTISALSPTRFLGRN